MSKGISPAVTVIVIVLVIIIAGLLWYIYSTPKAEPGVRQGMEIKPITPATAPNLPEAKAKARMAEKALQAQEKATMSEAQQKMKAAFMKAKAEQKAAKAAPAKAPGR